jgi:hypothetical protein
MSKRSDPIDYKTEPSFNCAVIFSEFQIGIIMALRSVSHGGSESIGEPFYGTQPHKPPHSKGFDFAIKAMMLKAQLWR